jgi:SAM-dependent methyltransferase
MSRSPAPLNSHWDGRPHEYDELRACWLNQRRLAFLVDQIRATNLPSGATVLEVGSGTGWLLRRLAARFPEHRFVELEPDAAYVDFARQNAQPNEQHSVGVAEELEAGRSHQSTCCSPTTSSITCTPWKRHSVAPPPLRHRAAFGGQSSPTFSTPTRSLGNTSPLGSATFCHVQQCRWRRAVAGD